MSVEFARDYSLPELAAALGVDPSEALEILDEHGYEMSTPDAVVRLSRDELSDLIEAPPLGPEGDER